ncbi:hypothetical protein I6A84_21735 [Frankia sp. CNm7]|uniref:SAM-dependent methyltransferase n=2 Tax=Frankia nepalensis TaxID=1836974 RepID=A0A937RHJ1_9ACTN|nr:hypothetical protein [Frankia nepalensis]MBL7511592.1 hypothetical protein [Frankia nepalensis]MBL7520638.1 hypothetical protein [Frankia nepalensis]MBL7630267.1 SAM-dependent methyltransferase [Frankia nepalensis]
MPDARWLSVWPTGQQDLAQQLLAGGYLPATEADGAAIPPAVAAHAIAAYSRPGDVVYDPDCGTGTVCVEAVRARRHAVGATADPRCWELARANLTLTKRHGATGDGMILDGVADGWSRTGLAAPVDLVLTAARATDLAISGPGPDRDSSPDPDGADGPSPETDPGRADRLRARLSDYTRLTRPGGLLVIVGRPGPCRDGAHLAGVREPLVELLIAGRAAGLAPVDRCVALTAAITTAGLRSHLASRPGSADPGDSARPLGVAPAQAGGRPSHLPAHLDVVVFRRVAVVSAAASAAAWPSAAADRQAAASRIARTTRRLRRPVPRAA